MYNEIEKGATEMFRLRSELQGVRMEWKVDLCYLKLILQKAAFT